MATPPPNAPFQVIVADDDAEMRAYIGHTLRSRATVLEAASGDEVLRLAQSLTPDLIIADIQMPGLDGVSLCRALREDPRTRDVPFLLVSGESRAPPDCADGFLVKPFNAGGLRAHVDLLLGFEGC